MNKMYVFFTFLSLFLMKNTIAFCTTLSEAMQLAYKNSEQVYMKLAQKDMSSIDRDTAIMNLLPQVEMNFTHMNIHKSRMEIGEQLQHQITGMSSLVPAGGGEEEQNAKKTKYSQSASITATASLSYYKTIPAIIASQKNVSANNYEYNEFLENFGLLFIQKYMDVIYYSNAKEVYSKMSETLEKKVKRMSIMNRYGTAKKDKVVVAEAQYYENEANKISMQSLLEKAKMDYKIMTGIEPENLQVPELTNVALPAKNKNDFIALVLSSNSKLLKTKSNLSSQKALMTAQSLNLLPDIFAIYSYNRSNVPRFMKYSYDYFGLGVSWTINGPDNRLNGARKSYKNYRIADLNKSLTEKEVEQDASYSWDQYFAMVELVKATEKALKASSDSLREIKVSVATGTATFVDEMDIETQYLNANLNYLNAQKSLVLAYYKLISLTGVGHLPIR